MQKSLDLGLIDYRLDDSMIKQMDIILLTIPVDGAMDRLVDLLDEVNDNALIIDFGSTKTAICQQVALHSKARDSFWPPTLLQELNILVLLCFTGFV